VICLLGIVTVFPPTISATVSRDERSLPLLALGRTMGSLVAGGILLLPTTDVSKASILQLFFFLPLTVVDVEACNNLSLFSELERF